MAARIGLSFSSWQPTEKGLETMDIWSR